MTHWEYLVSTVVTLDAVALDERGSAGWELVALHTSGNLVQAVFKRQVKRASH